MAYREDLDALARQRACEDDQAALLASFRSSERSRGRRAFAAWIGGLAVVGAIYGVSLAGPMPRHHRSRHVVSPQSITLRLAADFEYAAAKQRARAREAMQALSRAPDATEPVGLFDVEVDVEPGVTQGVPPFNPSEYVDLVPAVERDRR